MTQIPAAFIVFGVFFAISMVGLFAANRAARRLDSSSSDTDHIQVWPEVSPGLAEKMFG